MGTPNPTSEPTMENYLTTAVVPTGESTPIMNETATTATQPPLTVINVPNATSKMTMETNATMTKQSALPSPAPPDDPIPTVPLPITVVVSQGSTATLDTATMAEAESVEAADERTAIPGDGNAPADILSSSSTAAMPRTEILAAFAISVFLYVGL